MSLSTDGPLSAPDVAPVDVTAGAAPGSALDPGGWRVVAAENRDRRASGSGGQRDTVTALVRRAAADR